MPNTFSVSIRSEKIMKWAPLLAGIIIVSFVLDTLIPAFSYASNGYAALGILYMMMSKHYEVTADASIPEVTMGSLTFILLWPFFYLAVKE